MHVLVHNLKRALALGPSITCTSFGRPQPRSSSELAAASRTFGGTSALSRMAMIVLMEFSVCSRAKLATRATVIMPFPSCASGLYISVVRGIPWPLKHAAAAQWATRASRERAPSRRARATVHRLRSLSSGPQTFCAPPRNSVLHSLHLRPRKYRLLVKNQILWVQS